MRSLKIPKGPVMQADVELSEEPLQVTLLDARTKEIVCDAKGSELDVSIDDTERLRKALGCPLQSLDGEVAASISPILKSAERKLQQQLQSTDALEAEKAISVVEAMIEINLWAAAFPQAVFNIC